MSDKDDNVVAFPNPWESRKEEDEPVWHVIRNEHSENFEAWIVTATSKTSGEVTSYGTFPNMGSVQLFLTYFNFDETNVHEAFPIGSSITTNAQDQVLYVTGYMQEQVVLNQVNITATDDPSTPVDETLGVPVVTNQVDNNGNQI